MELISIEVPDLEIRTHSRDFSRPVDNCMLMHIEEIQ